METIFSKIIKGTLPSFKVAESKDFLAFLDINPNQTGHTLCVTKKEQDKFLDLSVADYQKLMFFSRKVALAIQETIPCKRVGMSIIGLEVPHVHVHLIPLNLIKDATFQSKVETTPEQLAQTALAIAKVFQNLP